ncbi:MAG: sigma-70 family RNA polymerase sigma factor [Oscillospiraceae bacterium]|jgi:RNA polymerase sporulation-specific sigma factor|nr:sigma-70 family RNA polymerase sigma factor [Oscillospiraceae bacterium]
MPEEQTLLTHGSDETLAQLAQAGNAEAFALLIARTVPLAQARAAQFFSAGRGAAQTAEDLAQEGMLGALSAVTTFRPEKGASFRTYASACINNRILSALRRGRSEATVPLPEEDLPARGADADPQDIFSMMEETHRVMEAIRLRLTDLERGVAEAYLAGERYDQIAARLQVTPKAVDNAIQRVRRKLKEFR